MVLILLRVLDGAALADDVDLDLAGIIEGILDLLGDLAGQQDDLIIADDIGLDHDADFAAGLNGKGLLHALKAGRDLLQIFQTLDVVELAPNRLLVEDTDAGKSLSKKITDLKALVDAYLKGKIKTH